MAAIPGSVRVTGFIAPTDTADTYPSHDATYGRGGMRSVADLTERNAIPADRRQAGMLVYVEADTTTYQLNQPPWDFTNADWVVFSSGGGGGSLGGDAVGPASSNVVERIQGNPVSSLTPTAGQGLVWDGVNWAPATLGGDTTGSFAGNTVERIQNNPVSSLSPISGQALTWNGFEWVPSTLDGDTTGALTNNTLSKLHGTNVIIVGPSNGQILTYVNDGEGPPRWSNMPSSSGSTLLGDVTGPIGANTVTRIQNIPVILFSPSNGQVLTYVNDGEFPPYWSNVSSGGGGGTLAGDVTGPIGANTVTRLQNRNVSSGAPAPDQVLAWNSISSAWVPQSIGTIYSPPSTYYRTVLINARLSETAIYCGSTFGTDWQTSYGIYLSSMPQRVGFYFSNNIIFAGGVSSFSCASGTSHTITVVTPGTLDIYSEMYVAVRAGFTGATSPTISIGTSTDPTRWVNALSISSTGVTYVNLSSVLGRDIDGPEFGLTGNITVRFNVASGLVSNLVGRLSFSFLAGRRAQDGI